MGVYWDKHSSMLYSVVISHRECILPQPMLSFLYHFAYERADKMTH